MNESEEAGRPRWAATDPHGFVVSDGAPAVRDDYELPAPVRDAYEERAPVRDGYEAPVRVQDVDGPDLPAVAALGAPAHSGPKAPSYPPVPQGLPAVAGDLAAAVLPDIVLDGAAYPGVTVRAASVRGDSHRYAGEPRQDALCVTRIGGDEQGGELLMLAVADGVGSAPRSHVGSNEACRLAARYLDRSTSLHEAIRTADAEGFQRAADNVVRQIGNLLGDLALQHDERPDALATTLRILLVPLDPRIRTRGFLAVGDGGAALLRRGFWHLDFMGDADGGKDGDVIDTRTAALPRARTAVTRLIHPAQPGDVIVLSTDGLSSPLAGDAGMRDFLKEAWTGAEVPAPADFLWQFQYRVKSYDDDRTAVVLWEHEEAQ
ncbi:protein phosphatase 2C domain-containing protein [Streptomyces sp. NPDC090032]|uniref:protein phosphatase 2C domain-containing protein n=1 Tax=unclassified Streptomyces TaxID=2593676 RepID=UPI003715E1BE